VVSPIKIKRNRNKILQSISYHAKDDVIVAPLVFHGAKFKIVKTTKFGADPNGHAAAPVIIQFSTWATAKLCDGTMVYSYLHSLPTTSSKTRLRDLCTNSHATESLLIQ